jgi:NAD(P)-dependent dehydrogenase (short-subunit alcohol dehydrogenase family)
MLVSESTLAKDSLKDQVVVITGAGRGIGYEAARAFLWLGANVVIAEIDEETGKSAAENLEREFGRDKALFVKTDVGSDKDVENLAKEVIGKWGKVDIVLNNATVFLQVQHPIWAPMRCLKQPKANLPVQSLQRWKARVSTRLQLDLALLERLVFWREVDKLRHIWARP